MVASLHQWALSQAWLASLVVVVAQYGVFVLPIASLVLWFRARAGDPVREAILAGCVAAVVAVAVGLVLERSLHRPRPFVELGLVPLFPHADDSSFPSDHSLVGMAFVGPLLWSALRPGAMLTLWVLLFGFARVAAGVHYPSDILGSVVLALGIDALAWYALPSRLLVRLRLLRSDGRPPDSPP